ncbi:prolyl-tRNA synthetase [bacterium]|nr:prolyl-tRNA synthetase [bacterium]
MKQSQLFTKTIKDLPKDETSLNAQLLLKAGFVEKTMAGVYQFLPLGLKVLVKIENIIREEMNNIGGQEILMSALAPKENWEITGRLETMNVLMKTIGANVESKRINDSEYVLNSTHEEIITPIAKKYALSYKDLPFSAYQIQTKFRNEARPKSGLLRGREFRMKDLYSFHESQEDMEKYYEVVKEAYVKIFDRLGLGKDTYITLASGGDFTTGFSHEFQTECETGEDEIHVCDKCKIALNKEVLERQSVCPECGSKDLRITKASEVGNIFPLNTKFSKAFKYNYINKEGKQEIVYMASYGIGPSRVMGLIVEKFADEKGMIWPEAIAPFKVHLISLNENEEADKIYEKFKEQGIEIIYDDRDVSTGVKLADADLIGCPYRVVVSSRTLKENKLEFKKRDSEEVELLSKEEVLNKVKIC